LIDAMKATYPVTVMAGLLGVNPRSYHAWAKRPPSVAEVRRMRLTSLIVEIHRASWFTYGSPRIHAELLAMGERVSKQLVEKLMRQAGIHGVKKRKKGRPPRRDLRPLPSPDLVDRQFVADGPNELWVADMTYKLTGEGWAYVATITDVWSRMCVGWAISHRIDTDLAMSALELALSRRRGLTGLVLHSDQGSPYGAIRYQRALTASGIISSMGTTGDAYDNAMAESVNSTLKADLIDEYHWPTRAALASALMRYIEGFYNPRRRHTSLGNVSPLEYEKCLSERDAA
jgi:putative transposase